MRTLAVLLLIASCGDAGGQSVTIIPWAPTSADVILVNVLLGEITVRAQSHSVLGNTVTVTIDNNGPSFLPSPPGVATEPVGPLPPGAYNFVVSVLWGSTTIVTTLPVVVSVAPPAAVRSAIEYYYASLDHYFITSDPAEIHDLDTGVHIGWSRTGYSFNTNVTAANGDGPVCRFYIPPSRGDSHFFSVLRNECKIIEMALVTAYPEYFAGYLYESPNVFYMGVPNQNTGACPVEYLPVYRLWNNRGSSNHRYTTDPAVKAQMIAQGWVSEGYGPNAVAMCAPS